MPLSDLAKCEILKSQNSLIQQSVNCERSTGNSVQFNDEDKNRIYQTPDEYLMSESKTERNAHETQTLLQNPDTMIEEDREFYLKSPSSSCSEPIPVMLANKASDPDTGPITIAHLAEKAFAGTHTRSHTTPEKQYSGKEPPKRLFRRDRARASPL